MADVSTHAGSHRVDEDECRRSAQRNRSSGGVFEAALHLVCSGLGLLYMMAARR
jgi:hypothetical protein